jgi:hypothetical protein
MAIDSISKTDQGFPNIKAPFINSDGSINQIWLQLLITLWNRTGLGPGVSTADALHLATMQENRQPDSSFIESQALMGADINNQISLEALAEALIPFLAVRAEPTAESLDSTLFDVIGAGSSSSPPVTTQIPVFAPAVTGELPGPTLIANVDGTCVMVHVDCVDNPC